MITTILLLMCLCIFYTDISSRVIPNKQLGVILFCSLLIANDLYELHEILISITACFIIGIVTFYIGVWGGGDSKFIISLSPLVPPEDIPYFFMSVLLCGGVLSLFYLFKYRFYSSDEECSGLPYGVAIGVGAGLFFHFSKGLPIYS